MLEIFENLSWEGKILTSKTAGGFYFSSVSSKMKTIVKGIIDNKTFNENEKMNDWILMNMLKLTIF